MKKKRETKRREEKEGERGKQGPCPSKQETVEKEVLPKPRRDEREEQKQEQDKERERGERKERKR